MKNSLISLSLDDEIGALPFIRNAVWTDSQQPVFEAKGGDGDALPHSFFPVERVSEWENDTGEPFHSARRTVVTATGMLAERTVELHHTRPVLRTRVSLHNPTDQEVDVPWFPIFHGNWSMPTRECWVRWWKALSYERCQQPVSAETVALGSFLHSSDARYDATSERGTGTMPYWMIGHRRGRLFFGLAWSGGWKASIGIEEDRLRISAHLPDEESQLNIRPGETVDGPMLYVYCTRETEDARARETFMEQREQLAQELYGGPTPQLPLVWNHWYSCRFDFDCEYFLKQADAMDEYGFDYFVVDAGWYEEVGEWTPDSDKFKPDELESGLTEIAEDGIPVGIWSCPQYVSDRDDRRVDEPVYRNDFIDGYLLNMAGMDFSSYLTNHVRNLRRRFQIDWWKYDQEIFVGDTRDGTMRNVLSFQRALEAVREAEPDLVIENCQSGGRMISEFTSLLTQVHWIRDGGHNGLEHARQNIRTGLGAMDCLFPWSCFRWSNNISKMDPADDELTRMYCRSAMLGLWGISDDLSRIPQRQKRILREEIEHYRRINPVKRHALYEIYPPQDGASFAGVIYYDTERTSGVALLFRWDAEGAFLRQMPLNLTDENQYQLEDVDRKTTRTVSGEELSSTGLTVEFAAEQRSRLYMFSEG